MKTDILKAWLREPLLHFFAVAALVFAADSTFNSEGDEDAPQKIFITQDDLLQMQVALRSTQLPPRNSPQFQNLIEARVREEVLYREALAMGLDKGDTIVKRRMAQKMDFLAEDLSALREPTRGELQAWFTENPNDFTLPSRITFRHVFFSFDTRGKQAQQDAIKALADFDDQVTEIPAGDPFMFQDYYPERTPVQVSSVFGPDFSQRLFEHKENTWAGPIQSGFGWHLIHIDSLTPARMPAFEEVFAEVKADWTANQREVFKQTAYQTMREKYEVVLPEPAPQFAAE
ncbi:peptidyl-prolyl cis-trans isomerase [Microbulbifer elongatus]|uniref:peptidylprolyl isomerase n=1 Tax=Microbulbifer elongatus TaxID=86173 RepID=A0ABT1NWB9_9GAMM|nr:peptidylprolyl isomerase [Microbulbifer elongatus]MCQ3828170.1 peptidyl-prolyl cis-trans isomerase [Microbulbifer elongatus]